jgi:hypothetical protein
VRTVARFQFYCEQDSSSAYASAVGILREWADREFAASSAGTVRIRKSERDATFSVNSDSVPYGNRTSFLSTEIVGDALIELSTIVLEYSSQLFFQSSIRVAAANGSFIEPSVSVRAPRFVQNILRSGHVWQSRQGADRVFSKTFLVGIEEYEAFEQLLLSSERHLPIIAVSNGMDEFQDISGLVDIDAKILWSCCGLAHVCRLSQDASWRLTASLGKEWSCYNGAIRCYWPNLSTRKSPWVHRLWTQSSLKKILGSSDNQAALSFQRLVNQYTRPHVIFHQLRSSMILNVGCSTPDLRRSAPKPSIKATFTHSRNRTPKRTMTSEDFARTLPQRIGLFRTISIVYLNTGPT